MDPRLLQHYNQELQHLREMGAEFAEDFPKIAARLGMSGIEVADPYVERLLEGFAFLAARVQVKLDAEFPRFTQRLLEIVYPDYLAPTPSMLIAQFRPQAGEAGLASGFTIPRGTALRSSAGRIDQTGKEDLARCEFRTAQDTVLWPLTLCGASYFTWAPDLPLSRLRLDAPMKSGIRLKLRTTAGLTFDQLKLDSLRLFLAGSDEAAFKLHELIFGHCLGVLVAPAQTPWPWHEFLAGDALGRAGFEDDQALLPVGLRSFQGHRLIQEYVAFAPRFLFVDINALSSAISRHHGDELEIVLLFSRHEAGLEGIIDADNFALHCVPAINLFPKRGDRVHLSNATNEYHVVPDRTRPMDYEVYDLTSVTGYGVGSDSQQAFRPLYAAYHMEQGAHRAWYTLRREPRLLSPRQQRNGARSSYIGSEVFIALVDPDEAPYRSDLRQLAVTMLCSNRDLPLLMPLGGGNDFSLEIAAPVEAIQCLKGPSRPSSPLAQGAVAWRFISQLSLNYLSLIDTSPQEGAAVLRQILRLYANSRDDTVARQIEGIHSLQVKPLTRRLPMAGPISVGRGLEVTIEVSELAFQGGSAFLFGMVMERFFARHVSLNSFTETVLRTQERGEIMRWVPRCGTKPIL